MTAPTTARQERAALRIALATADPGVVAWVETSLPPWAAVCAVTDEAAHVAGAVRAGGARLCLVDVALPGAVAAVRALEAGVPAVLTVAWAASAHDPRLVEALEAGAAGCIAGRPRPEALARALGDVLDGRRTLPRALVGGLVAQLRG